MDVKASSNLLHMPLVILRILLEDLYESDRGDFLNFRLVSRACRYESEYLLFQSIALHDDTRAAKSGALILAERIMDISGHVGEYVRHLRFGPFADEKWFYFDISPLLEGILRSIKRLQSLTWNTHHAVRPPMLNLFHKLHPSARLHLILRDRKFRPLSPTLLSSPQLHTLDISVYCARDDNIRRYSELQFVKDCLGTSLRVLRLHVSIIGVPPERRQLIGWEHARPGLIMFDWVEGDRFAALEELTMEYNKYTLPCDNYAFTPEHCNMWARVTSWAQLQKLDLGMGSPRHFFASLTGRAINLKYLKFWISPARNSTWDLQPMDTGLPVLGKFIASITALRELEFGAHDFEDCMGALSQMLGNSRGSLRWLVLRSGAYSMPAWSPEQYVEILDHTPGLGYFKAIIDEDTVEGSWKGSERYRGPWEKFESATKDIKFRPQPQSGQNSQYVRRLVW